MSDDGENGKPTIAGALTYPTAAHSTDVDVPQPRQPHSLQGLLRFAMEATQAEDAPGGAHHAPMDPERSQFLEQALKTMTVDVTELLLQNVKTLSKASSLPVDGDASECLEAIQTISEYVGDMDTAVDFHKIGGFAVLPGCLDSVHPSIRAQACDLVAELCQNNPQCQVAVLDGGLLPVLLGLVDDASDHVCTKALYAVSCTVRENELGCAELRRLDGLRTLLRALLRPSDRARSKAAFLLASLTASKPGIGDELCDLGIVAVLAGLAAERRRPSHELVLQLLRALATHCPSAAVHCHDPALGLRAALRSHLVAVADTEQYAAEAECCRDILAAVFADDPSDADR